MAAFLRFLHRTLFLINLCWIVLLLLSYFVVFVNPSKINYIGLLGLGYPLFLFVNIFFVIYWIIRRKWLFIASLLTIVLGWYYITIFFQINRNDAQYVDNKSFKLLSYNVRLFDLYKWLNEKDAPEKIYEFVNQTNADVVCFQEYYSNINKNIRATDILTNEYNYKYSYWSTYSRKGGQAGVATFSRYPIINHGNISFTKSRNVVIYTDIQIDNHIVRVFNCHLESNHFGYDNYQFIDSLDIVFNEKKINGIKDIFSKLDLANSKRAIQADKLMGEIANSPYPVIVCGDFNDSPMSYTYQQLCYSLSDAFVEAGNGFGHTYQRSLIPFRIDYILHSKQLTTVDFLTHKQNLSDHHPLECRLSFK